MYAEAMYTYNEEVNRTHCSGGMAQEKLKLFPSLWGLCCTSGQGEREQTRIKGALREVGRGSWREAGGGLWMLQPLTTGLYIKPIGNEDGLGYIRVMHVPW